MAVFSSSPDLQNSNQQPEQSLFQFSSSRDVKSLDDFDWIKECLQGVVVVTAQKETIYASEDARQILGRFGEVAKSCGQLPEELWHICQMLIQSRCQFPHQNWLIKFDIVTQSGSVLHVRARWSKGETLGHPYLVLLLEDQQQALTNILVEEAKKYCLTSREKEVWVLHRNGLTYKQIAKQLGITPNTVKKHMRSIHNKRKKAAAA